MPALAYLNYKNNSTKYQVSNKISWEFAISSYEFSWKKSLRPKKKKITFWEFCILFIIQYPISL